MKLTQVTAGFGLTVALPAYGSARVYREYTATVARGDNAAAVEAQLEEMARESVLAFIAAEPWKVEPGPTAEPEREHRVISSFDPEAA